MALHRMVDRGPGKDASTTGAMEASLSQELNSGRASPSSGSKEGEPELVANSSSGCRGCGLDVVTWSCAGGPTTDGDAWPSAPTQSPSDGTEAEEVFPRGSALSRKCSNLDENSCWVFPDYNLIQGWMNRNRA